MNEKITHDVEVKESSALSRRKFLTYAGVLAGAGMLIASCHKDENDSISIPSDAVDLGSSDQGLLNYAFLIKQLKAAFYTQVIATPFFGMTPTEKGFFTDMRDHEIAQREFLRSYLTTFAIPMLETDFSSVDFGLKSSVYAKAKQFEELSTAGLAGVCKLMSFSDNLLYATKINSVDARHSATVNDFITPGTFAEKTDSNGMEQAQDPQTSLETTRKFFKRTITGNYLPRY